MLVEFEQNRMVQTTQNLNMWWTGNNSLPETVPKDFFFDF